MAGISQVSFIKATSCTLRDCHDWCASWGICSLSLILWFILFWIRILSSFAVILIDSLVSSNFHIDLIVHVLRLCRTYLVDFFTLDCLRFLMLFLVIASQALWVIFIEQTNFNKPCYKIIMPCNIWFSIFYRKRFFRQVNEWLIT